MEIDNMYKFRKTLRLKKSDFRNKLEFAEFIKYLNNQMDDGRDNEGKPIYQLFNEKYRIRTDNFEEFYSEIINSSSIIEIDMASVGNQSGIHLTYTTLYLIKNNCKITIFADDSEMLNTLLNNIYSELEKYKNEVRVLFFKILTTILFLC
ncbi:MAG: hypothetical protein WDZ91_07865 [Paenibacillaceae bacterium]